MVNAGDGEETSFGDILGRASPTEDYEEKPQPKPRKPPVDKPLDANMTAAEVRKTMAFSLNGVARAFRLPDPGLVRPEAEGQLHFEQDEFSEASEAFVMLANQHPQIRILMRLLIPLASIGAAFEAIDRLVAGFKLRAERQRLEKLAKEQGRQEPVVNGTTDEPAKRGLWPLGR